MLANSYLAHHHLLRSQYVDGDNTIGKCALNNLKVLRPVIVSGCHASEGSLNYCVTSQTWPRNSDLLRDAVG